MCNDNPLDSLLRKTLGLSLHVPNGLHRPTLYDEEYRKRHMGNDQECDDPVKEISPFFKFRYPEEEEANRYLGSAEGNKDLNPIHVGEL